ncbi:hypothetical protein ACERC8_01270 [Streptococcus sp. E29BA]|uniref:hypothetical protein n=1 Tax=Streptococcus sp. E29BA TaxID=3278716 RepID=UPI00359D878F
MIKFTGKTTDKRSTYAIEADSYRDLMEQMIDQELADGYWNLEGQLFHAIAKISKDVEDFKVEYEQLLEDDKDAEAESLFENFSWEAIFETFSDVDWQFVIRSANSQAYYQEFEVI